MGLRPQYIEQPVGYVGSVQNSTVAVTVIVPGAGEIVRLENMTVQSDHTAAVTIEVIRFDGAAEHILLSKEILAKGFLNVFEERFGIDASKQFQIVQNPHAIRIRTTTAVAGKLTFEANGGLY